MTDFIMDGFMGFFPFVLDKLCQLNASILKILWIGEIILCDFFSTCFERTEKIF